MMLIEIALALAALYCGGMWLFAFGYAVLRGDSNPVQTELETFHLGLCFILAIGFLGLMLK